MVDWKELDVEDMIRLGLITLSSRSLVVTKGPELIRKTQPKSSWLSETAFPGSRQTRIKRLPQSTTRTLEAVLQIRVRIAL